MYHSGHIVCNNIGFGAVCARTYVLDWKTTSNSIGKLIATVLNTEQVGEAVFTSVRMLLTGERSEGTARDIVDTSMEGKLQAEDSGQRGPQVAYTRAAGASPPPTSRGVWQCPSRKEQETRVSQTDGQKSTVLRDLLFVVFGLGIGFLCGFHLGTAGNGSSAVSASTKAPIEYTVGKVRAPSLCRLVGLSAGC